MENYKGEKIIFNGCPGCAYAKHEFVLPCGMAYENDRFTISQDWEFPIEGFMIVSIKRHVERIVDLSEDERKEMFDLAVKTINILRNNKIAEEFEVIFYEKDDTHLHAWVLPRKKWMIDLVKNVTCNIGKVLEYAKKNFSNDEVFEKIKNVSDLVGEKLRELDK